MVALSQIRRLTIEARSDGVDKVARDLQGVADGQRAVAETGALMAASEDKVSKSTLSVERQLQRLQGRIDPLFRATRELDSSMRLLDRAVAQGSITETEHARALGLVQTHYERATLAAKNRAVVAGAGRSVDYRNLSFQLNDVMTMGMMGANPSQIIASQGGQIFQSLQMAKGGVVGGLKEIGSDVMSLVGRFPLVTAGALAAGAAMTVFYAATRNGMPTAEQALERHAELVKKIGEQYRQSGAAVESFAVGSPDGVLKAYAKQNEVVLRARYEEEARALAMQNRPMNGIAAANDVVHKSALAAPVDALMASVRDGKPDVLAFQRAISEIYLNPQTPVNVRNLAMELLKSSESASKLALMLPQAEQAIDAASRRANDLARNQTLALEGMRQLNGYVPDQRTDRQKIEDIYGSAIGSTENMGQVETLNRQRATALAELNRQLDITRQLDELGARAVLARTVAEKADIAATQARLQAIRQYGAAGADLPETRQAEANARAQVAADALSSARRTLEAAQTSASQVGLTGLPAQIAAINARYADTIRDASGAAEAVERLERARRLEIDTATRSATVQPLQEASRSADELERSLALSQATFGRSVGETAGLNEQMRLYNQYVRAGVEITPQLAGQIAAAGNRYGDLAGKIDQVNKAQSDAIGRMDGFRSASKSAIGSLINGDWSGALSSFSNFFVDQFSTQLTQGLLGRDGEAGGGLFGNSVMGLLGGGTRGASASNPLYVTFGAGGLPSLFGGTGTVDDVWSKVLPTRAANTNAFGLVGGTDALSIYRQAISDIESSGNYGALGPLTKSGDRAYGAYQVMGANVPSWTKATLGTSLTPQQFLGNPQAQDAVFNRYFGSYLSKYGNANDAASTWFTGRPLANGAGLADVTGTTGSVYVDRFNQALDRATNGLQGFASSAKNGGNQLGQGGSYPASLPLTPAQASMMPAGVSPYGTGWANQQLSGMSGVFQQLTNGLGSLVDNFLPGFGNILSMLLNGLGSGGGSGLFGLLGGLFAGGGGGWAFAGQGAAFGLYADGGVPPGGISAYRNTIVNRPTMFAFANGGGIMGEAGEEGILPLRRNGRGQLGVYAAIGSSDGSGGGSVNLSIGDVHVTVPEGTDTQNAARIGSTVRQELMQIVDQRMKDQLRSGGMLSRSAFK
ncbi:MAG: phage tape measure protein [Proteobacteria bacterium]|nr:phage tape measure protein [Pseudomonadota bacterium]